MTSDRYNYYNTEFDKLNAQSQAVRGDDYSQLQMDVYNGMLDYNRAMESYNGYDERVRTLQKEIEDADNNGASAEEIAKLEDKLDKAEQRRNEAHERASDIMYGGDPPKLWEKKMDLEDRNQKLNEISNKQDKLNEEFKNEVDAEAEAAEKNRANKKGPIGEAADSIRAGTKSETNEAAKEVGQPDSSNPENKSDSLTPDNAPSYNGQSEPKKEKTIVDNFKLPNWDYRGYVQEMQQFKKGTTSITGEPGWFYFKLIFHFDDSFGLLGNIVHNGTDETHRGNTAIQYLSSRAARFKQDNLKSRAIALEKFVKYLSFINSSCPWFFDKVTGLNEVIPQLNEFSKEKKLEISCMPDAIDMRLTSLLYLYQYACYDDIYMKEIIPENLRKFNMSVIIYHMPVKFHSTTFNGGSSIQVKSLYDNGNFSNRMSYKLYTFKGCEIDLTSIGNAVPNTLDNQQPFNLGQNNITIRYDRAFTHVMNEWEQFMIGSDGYYYNQEKQIGIVNETNKYKERIDQLIQANDAPSRQILDGILTKGATTFADRGQLIGNIYNLDIEAYKQNTLMERSQPIYLYNLFNIDVYYFKALALARSTEPGRRIGRGVNGEGISKFPGSNELAQMFNTGTTYRLFNLSNSAMATNYISHYDLLVHEYYNKNRIYASTWYMQPYQTSVADIVTQYKNAWKDIKGIFKANVNAVKNIGKDIARSWGF